MSFYPHFVDKRFTLTNSALWAELVRELTCPSVCVSVECPLPMQFFSRPLIGPQIT